MKTAVCYYSRHHGNTLKVLQAMAAEGDVELIDVTARQTVRLDDYDCIGFASGIYGFEFQKSVGGICPAIPAPGKPVFFVYTYGGAKGTGAKAVKEIAANMGAGMGSSITITDDAGSQLLSDLGRSAIQGVSQYVSKKMRSVKVTLKAGYSVLLLPPLQ